jgi:hypothetical protein
MTGAPPSTGDLRDSERRFVAALQLLGYGRLEGLLIRYGELVLDPWPTTIRDVKFGSRANQPEPKGDDFLLKQQVVEFFEHIRSVDSGVIRALEVKNGLPFTMEIEHRPDFPEGGRHA